MAASTPLSRHLLFETTDADEAAEYLTNAYGTRFQLSGGRKDYFYQQSRLVSEIFSIDSCRMTSDTTFTVNAPPVLFVARPRNVRMCYWSGDVTHRLGPSEVILCNSTEDAAPFRTELDDGALDAAVLPFALLYQVAATAATRRPEPIRFTDLRPTTPAATRHLTATIDFLADAIRDRPQSMSEPLVTGTAGRMLAAAVLTAFPNTTLTEPTTEDRHDAHPRTLHRAITFIDESAQCDISVADVAEAANVTIRALQHAFRRHLGTTPMGYLRQVRLRHAHQDLLAADPTTGVTVTEIAARWGFFHPGRFAHYYRDTYGCVPYRTLLRG
jgi:AraC-like DNA-binding protein